MLRLEIRVLTEEMQAEMTIKRIQTGFDSMGDFDVEKFYNIRLVVDSSESIGLNSIQRMGFEVAFNGL
jgi:hypothetical protein